MLLTETLIEILCQLLRVHHEGILDALFHIHDSGILVNVEGQPINIREEKISLIKRFIFYKHEVALLSLFNRSDPEVMQPMWLKENKDIAVSLLPQLQVKFLAE